MVCLISGATFACYFVLSTDVDGLSTLPSIAYFLFQNIIGQADLTKVNPTVCFDVSRSRFLQVYMLTFIFCFYGLILDILTKIQRNKSLDISRLQSLRTSTIYNLDRSRGLFPAPANILAYLVWSIWMSIYLLVYIFSCYRYLLNEEWWIPEINPKKDVYRLSDVVSFWNRMGVLQQGVITHITPLSERHVRKELDIAPLSERHVSSELNISPLSESHVSNELNILAYKSVIMVSIASISSKLGTIADEPYLEILSNG